MNKRILLAILIAVLLGSCNSPELKQKPSVVVSILPQKYFVEQIADTLINVEVMVPPGSSPETYEPTAMQLQMFSKAKLYFSLGLLDFEKTTLKKVADQNSSVRVINHASSLNLIEGSCDHSHEGHSHAHGHDPHVWLSPAEVSAMKADILAALSKQFPEYSNEFATNASRFQTEIDSLNSYITRSLSSYKGAKIFIFHPALTYFVRDYSLVQVSLEEEGKSPSAMHLKKVMEQARNEGAKTIFIQKEFDANTAKTAAADIGGEIVVINPLEANWLSNMYSITDKVKKAVEQ